MTKLPGMLSTEPIEPVMKNPILPLLATVLSGLSLLTTLSADTGIHILEDFDGGADPEVIAVSEGQLVDVDGNGEMEGRFVTQNFSQIIQMRLEREGELIRKIEDYPVLVYDVAAVPGRSRGGFIQTQVHVGTNAASGGIYDIFPESQVPLPRSGKAVIVRLDLLKAKTRGGVALADLLKAFREGEGSHLRITITQQSSKDADTDFVYDNIRLERRE